MPFNVVSMLVARMALLNSETSIPPLPKMLKGDQEKLFNHLAARLVDDTISAQKQGFIQLETLQNRI